MKILRVIASMNPATGGPCQGIRYSTPDLRSMGCTNEVVCLDDPDSPYLCEDSFVIHALGRGIGPLCYHHRLFSWLKANISNYDAVIVHGLWLWPSMTTWLAIRSLKEKARRSSSSSESSSRSPIPDLPPPKIPPYFVMPHGMLDPWFQRDKSRRWKALRNSVYWHLIEKKVIRDASGVLFTCEQELQLARCSFSDYRPKREINIGYGVPDPPAHSDAMDQAFYETCLRFPKGQPYLLYLGRIHPKKGVDLLIRAYAKVFGDLPKAEGDGVEGSDKGADPAFQFPAPNSQLPALVIAGPGLDTSYGAKIRNLVHESRCGDCIHFPGMLTGNAKWGAFFSCEAFVLGSHQENFGIAVAEALSCGKPVLISNQVNICTEVETAGAGYVKPDTLDGMAALLREWKMTPTTVRKEMGMNSKKLFETRFHARAAAEDLHSILAQSHRS